jgi:hypothetical protein
MNGIDYSWRSVRCIAALETFQVHRLHKGRCMTNFRYLRIGSICTLECWRTSWPQATNTSSRSFKFDLLDRIRKHEIRIWPPPPILEESFESDGTHSPLAPGTTYSLYICFPFLFCLSAGVKAMHALRTLNVLVSSL